MDRLILPICDGILNDSRASWTLSSVVIYIDPESDMSNKTLYSFLHNKSNTQKWNKNGWKVGLCDVAASNQPFSLLGIHNTTAVSDSFVNLRSRFMKLYKRKGKLLKCVEWWIKTPVKPIYTIMFKLMDSRPIGCPSHPAQCMTWYSNTNKSRRISQFKRHAWVCLVKKHTFQWTHYISDQYE